MKKGQGKLFGLLLCGGVSSRMGTRKEEISWFGKTERQRLSSLLEQVTDRVFISQKDNTEQLENIVSDGELGFGPLAGMHAAHARFPEASWLVLSCDLPLMDLAHLQQLIDGWQSLNQDRAVAFESRFDSKSEPLAAIYSAEDLARIPGFFADENHHHCARCFFKDLPTSQLLTPTLPDAVDNCNTPEDKADIELRLQQGRGAIQIKLEHFAQLEAAVGETNQDWTSFSRTTNGVWEELSMRYKLKKLDKKVLRPVVNDTLATWTTTVKDGDTVSFLPPFAGG